MGIAGVKIPCQEHLLSSLLRLGPHRRREDDRCGTEEFGGLVDLFANVLNDGVARLVSRGLDRDYFTAHQDIRGLKWTLCPLALKRTFVSMLP